MHIYLYLVVQYHTSKCKIHCRRLLLLSKVNIRWTKLRNTWHAVQYPWGKAIAWCLMFTAEKSDHVPVSSGGTSHQLKDNLLASSLLKKATIPNKLDLWCACQLLPGANLPATCSRRRAHMAGHSWLLLQTHTVAILFHLPPSLFGDAY